MKYPLIEKILSESEKIEEQLQLYYEKFDSIEEAKLAIKNEEDEISFIQFIYIDANDTTKTSKISREWTSKERDQIYKAILEQVKLDFSKLKLVDIVEADATGLYYFLEDSRRNCHVFCVEVDMYDSRIANSGEQYVTERFVGAEFIPPVK